MNAPDCICSPGRLPLGAFCAGRDDLEREALHDDRISIRAPRAGCDFLRLQDIARALISIHAPRVGRDRLRAQKNLCCGHFNPRAPCGARRRARLKNRLRHLFQSTRPVWGATLTARRWPTDGKISIHAPRVGRDCCARMVAAAHSDFNPRAPCGVRRWASRSSDLPRQYFNPRTPCEVRQCAKCSRRLAACISIHAPRAGCDLARQRVVAGAVRISIHAPRAGCDDG